MKIYRLALIGFGNVGQGFARILQDKRAFFQKNYAMDIRIVAVSDLMKGSIYHPDGLPENSLLQAIDKDGTLANIQASHQGWDALQTIKNSNADVVVELSYTDLKTGQPALEHIETALSQRKHVITTNKGPIALKYPHLAQLASENGVQLGIEGTVMSGTPALFLGQEALMSADIQRIQGILNGTTNYILTRMELGLSYEEALAEAQAEGYAEADPTGDVEGYDATGKVVILANLFMGANITMDDVERVGITNITPDDVRQAQASGQRYKLIGTIERDGHHIKASVRPELVSLNHPLASVMGATNAITYSTELLGDVTLVGHGAGRVETGYALIEDLLMIHRKNHTK